MLILSRRSDEAVFIGDDIDVEVIEIRGNQVVLGIYAPDEVRILREELIHRGAKPPENSTDGPALARVSKA